MHFMQIMWQYYLWQLIICVLYVLIKTQTIWRTWPTPTLFVVSFGVCLWLLYAGHWTHSLKDRLAEHEYAIRTPNPQLSPGTALQRCRPQGPTLTKVHVFEVTGGDGRWVEGWQVTDSNISSDERPFGWKPSGPILPQVWIGEVTLPCSCDLIVWFKAWKCGLFGKLCISIFWIIWIAQFNMTVSLCLYLCYIHMSFHYACIGPCPDVYYMPIMFLDSGHSRDIGFGHPDEPAFNLSFLCVLFPSFTSWLPAHFLNE